MRNPIQTSTGFVVVCDKSGIIIEVIQNTTGYAVINENNNLGDLFISDNYFRLLEFFSLVKANKLVYNWEFSFDDKNQVSIFQLSAALFLERIVVFGNQVPMEVICLFNNLMEINNEQTNMLRSVIKSQISPMENSDTELFEEITRINNELIDVQRELTQKNKLLEKLNAEISALALTDPLTGLLNRRGFFQKADQAWEQACRYNRHASIIIFDIDHFKHVNDTHGHDVGDEVLVLVASWCKNSIRRADILCRYGGEEFCVFLPETTQEKAFIVAEKIREEAACPVETSAGILELTISLGIASRLKNMDDLKDLITNADQALYQAKEGGRNQTCVFQQ